MTVDILDDDAFRTELVRLIPQMRAFARSLCNDSANAEDLAQDALIKAWASRASYTMGTNMKAWTFMILRNQFYSDKRRSWRSCPLDPETAEHTLVAVDNPGAGLELDELRRALATLPDEQREALILIGAGGLSYQEAAEACGVPMGTVKSRVSRARDRLAQVLDEGGLATDETPAWDAARTIMEQVNVIRLGPRARAPASTVAAKPAPRRRPAGTEAESRSFFSGACS